jgi:hypothetical protein
MTSTSGSARVEYLSHLHIISGSAKQNVEFRLKNYFLLDYTIRSSACEVVGMETTYEAAEAVNVVQ